MTFQQPNNIADLVITFIVFLLGGIVIYGGHPIFGLILWCVCAFSVFSILWDRQKEEGYVSKLWRKGS